VANYAITTADLYAGAVTNTAIVYGESKAGQVTDKSDSANYTGNRPTVYVLKPVIAQPADIIIVDTAFCSGGIATLKARSTTVPNPVFRWYSDAGLNNLLYVGDTYTTTALSATTQYYVSVAGTLVLENIPNNGKVATVTVYPASPKPTVTASGATDLCPGGTVVLTSTAATTYQWFKDGVAIIGATARTYTARVLGIYSVSTTNANACPGPASDGIVIGNAPVPPTPVITATKFGFCIGDNATLSSNAATGNQWFRDGVAISGATGATLNVSTAGNYTVVVTNSSGCISAGSNPISIVVNALPSAPVIAINGTSKFCQGDTRIIKTTIPVGSTIQWFRNGALLSSMTADSLRVNDGANYTARIVNANGCISLLSNTVITEIGCVTKINLPDVFSPNGDGINDVIKPVIPGINKFRCFKVYNRWGNLVFETTDPTKGWDGRYKGQHQPAESYIWLVEGVDSNGKEIKSTGMFTLMR
jgi:gliding motility-associated-like protein